MSSMPAPAFVHPLTVRLHHTDAAGVIFYSQDWKSRSDRSD